MALLPGTRLGPYEIVAAIGAGGMGEVYRARDLRLQRDVAIKVLPEAFSADTDRLARFQREAQVLASLNHPNIAAIYGLEETGGSRALVMELVEGRDLSELVGALSLEDAIPITRQIADALEAAHDQGIIHRDLKPANVKVTPGGAVKVLDFGLAKAMDPTVGSGADPANSPTLTARATQMGMILGTAAYMAPEQARGRAVDRRVDIWAFGAVLYEVLTGQRAFQGDDATEVLAKIIEREADLSRLPASTPASLRRLMARCLVKDPKQRLRDIGEARVALDEAARELTQGPAPASTTAMAAPIARLRWPALLPWVIAAGLLIGLTWSVTRDPGTTAAPPRVTRLQLVLPPGIELYTAVGAAISMSPDGQTLAFVGVQGGVRQVFLRRLDAFDVIPIRGSESAVSAVFSPDGRELLVATSGSSLIRVRLSDNLVETVAQTTSDYSGGWISNDVVAFSKDGRLWMSGASGAPPTRLTEAEPGSTAIESQPIAVPGTQALLFVESRPEAPDSARIEALSIPDKKRTVVLERATGPLLSSTGHLLFVRDGVPLAVAFDRGTLKTVGEAAPILRDVNVVQNRGVGGTAATMTLSATGVLVYASTRATENELVSVSRQGDERTLLKAGRPAANPRLSPDGRRLVFHETGGGLWTLELDRRTVTRLRAANAFADFPLFSRDGRSIVFRTQGGLAVQQLDGTPDATPLPGTGPSEFPTGLTPDGNELLYTKIAAATSGDLYAIPIKGGQPRLLLSTAAYEGGAQLSPDGRWLVYVSSERTGSDIFLQPYPALDQRTQVSASGGIQPLWNPKGGEIFYRSGDKMMSVRLTVTPDGPVLTPPVVLFSGRYAYGGGLTIPNFAVAADGESFVLVKEPSAVTLNVELNWFEELKRLVPLR